MRLTRFENRLLTYNSFTFHFTSREAGVINVPMTTKQLDGVFTLIFDGDAVGKNKVVLAGTGICWLIFRLNCYLDSLGDFGYHRFQKYQFFGIPPQEPQCYDQPADYQFFKFLMGSGNQGVWQMPPDP
jgi:hypothetical protein